MVSDFFDKVNFFYSGSCVGAVLQGDSEGVDGADLLGDVQPSVWAKLKGRGVGDEVVVTANASKFACGVEVDFDHGSSPRMSLRRSPLGGVGNHAISFGCGRKYFSRQVFLPVLAIALAFLSGCDNLFYRQR